MSYNAITVLLRTGQSNRPLLEIVGKLAETLSASVTGVLSSQLTQTVYADGFGYIDPAALNKDPLEREASEAEQEFHHVLEPLVPRRRWHCALEVRSMADFLIHHASTTDLLVVQANAPAWMDDGSQVDLGAVVMQAGRPVLVLPLALEAVSLEHVLVGWKDTRETRRALVDALPLLRLAEHVTLCEVTSEQGVPAARSRLIDVAAWLRPHGVQAKYRLVAADDHALQAFEQLADEIGATLIVGGAYAHHRVREWILGGFTQDLLLRGQYCALVSH
ncbi:universal stress protein [Amantichitinum ursilacus]|uniref:Universal stress protein family protein n=1 Tax=Amantichitinum ursilacus TaxID=857265 RepID=A0A0N0GQ27_9NEIS|nr:universal stress protein [Amantichitinum ursilacus]KPC54245.1 Universal stress protein family protein [Amantichitinum ursilacus]